MEKDGYVKTKRDIRWLEMISLSKTSEKKNLSFYNAAF